MSARGGRGRGTCEHEEGEKGMRARRGGEGHASAKRERRACEREEGRGACEREEGERGMRV